MSKLHLGFFAPLGGRGSGWIRLLTALCVVGLAWPLQGRIHGEELVPPPHDPLAAPPLELLVPRDQLPFLLHGGNQRVFLKRSEYEQLKQTAQPHRSEELPYSAQLLAARYHLTLQGERAELTAELDVDGLQDSWQAVPLDLSGVALLSSQSAGQPAPLAMAANGQPLLLLAGKGLQTRELKMQVPVTISSALQTVSLKLPFPAATSLKVNVPGNVELAAGAAVIQRQYDATQNVTQFTLTMAGPDLQLVFSVNNRNKQGEKIVLAHTDWVTRLVVESQTATAVMQLSVLHGELNALRMPLPPDWEVTDASGPQLTSWQPVAAAAGQGPAAQELQFSFAEPIRGRTQLTLSLLYRGERPMGMWTFPQLQPADVVANTSTLLLWLDERLQLAELEAGSALPLDALSAAAAQPLVMEGTARLKPALALYLSRPDRPVRARFAQPEPSLDVNTRVLVQYQEGAHQLDATIVLTPWVERLFFLDILLPAEWNVEAITTEDETPLPWERVEAGPLARLRVEFPTPLEPDVHALRILANAVPSAWIGTWQELDVTLPRLQIPAATSHRGLLGVQADPSFVELQPGEISGVILIDETSKENQGWSDTPTQLCYEHADPNYQVGLHVVKKSPRLTAEILSFFKLDNRALHVRHELQFQASRAKATELQFTLPGATPESISIVGMQGLELKRTSVTPQGDRRLWTAELATPSEGLLQLAVDYEMPFPKGEEPLMLPVARAEQVAYQSGFMTLEGTDELEVEVLQSPERADVGEASRGEYQLGSHVLGVFGYQGAQAALQIKARQTPALALPTTVVEYVELLTHYGAQGVTQTRARFVLQTKEPFVLVELPAGCQFWGATVNGQATQPQVRGGALQIDMSQGESTRRELVLSYQCPQTRGLLLDAVKLQPPRLVVGLPDGSRREIPVADARWTAYLPENYLAIGYQGPTPESWNERRIGPWETLQQAFGLLKAGVTSLDRMESGLASVAKRIPAAAAPAASAIPESAVVSGPHSGPDGLSTPLFSDALERPQAEDKASDFALPAEGEAKDGPMNADQPPGLAELPNIQAQVESLDAASSAGALALNDQTQWQDQAGQGNRPQMAAAKPQSTTQTANSIQAAQAWEATGFRSLDIELQPSGTPLHVNLLGLDGNVQLTLLETSRWSAIAWCVTWGVVLLGLLLTRSGIKRQASYLLLVVGLSLLLPECFPGRYWIGRLGSQAIAGAAVLFPWYLLHGCVSHWQNFRRVGGATFFSKSAWRRSYTTSVSIALLAWETSFDSTACGQTLNVNIPGGTTSPTPALHIPAEALLIPYDPATALDGQQVRLPADHEVLVDHAEYQRLWELAHPEAKPGNPSLPSPFALRSAEWKTRLDASQEYLVVQGILELETLAEGLVEIPLSTAGGVLAAASVEGKPARLKFVAQPVVIDQKAQQARPAATGLLPVLQLLGPGKHACQLELHYPLQREGGWRFIQGELPLATLSQFRVTIPEPKTTVKLTGFADGGVKESDSDSTEILTALLTPQFGIRWRSAVTRGGVDPGLTANHQVVWTLRQDRIHALWQTELQFRQGERSQFRFLISPEYRVENLEAGNLRDWRQTLVEGQRVVDVELLTPARESATLLFRLARVRTENPQDPAAANNKLSAPMVRVEGASLQQGQILVQRGEELQIAVSHQAGLARSDYRTPQLIANPDPLFDLGLLGVKPFQAFTFSTVPFQLELQAEPTATEHVAEIRGIVRLMEQQTLLESQLIISPRGKALHQVEIQLPLALKLDQVDLDHPAEWHLEPAVGHQVLRLVTATPLRSPLTLVLVGRLPGAKSGNVPFPVLNVQNVKQQQGTLVLQADPDFDVEVRNPQGFSGVTLESTHSWLNPQQRELARSAWSFQSGNRQAAAQLTAKRSLVTAKTYSNVLIKKDLVLESVLLDFEISQAGVSELVFTLPERFRAAKVNAPLLRQTTLTPVAGNEPGALEFRLALQDSMLGNLRVLVELDRQAQTGSQQAAIPTLKMTGVDLKRQFVLLENGSARELIVESQTGLVPVSAAEQAFKELQGLFGPNVQQAFLVTPGTGVPQLSFRLATGEAVQTAGARIGLAEARFTLDARGEYRAQHRFHLENQTEQYLLLELPEGASLWGALVEERPVKPLPDAQGNPRRLRIPLPKTALGEDEFQVNIVYAGKLPALGWWQRQQVPLAKSVNIRVDKSQVRLWLPKSHCHWAFQGTMEQAGSEVELTQVALNFYADQISKLSQLVESETENEFAQIRIGANLRELRGKSAVVADRLRVAENAPTAAVGKPAEVLESAKQLALRNEELLNAAERKLAEKVQLQSIRQQEQALGNSARLKSYYSQQAIEQGRNRLAQEGNNWMAFSAINGEEDGEAQTMEMVDESELEATNQQVLQLDGRKQNVAPNQPVPQVAKGDNGRSDNKFMLRRKQAELLENLGQQQGERFYENNGDQLADTELYRFKNSSKAEIAAAGEPLNANGAFQPSNQPGGYAGGRGGRGIVGGGGGLGGGAPPQGPSGGYGGMPPSDVSERERILSRGRDLVELRSAQEELAKARYGRQLQAKEKQVADADAPRRSDAAAEREARNEVRAFDALTVPNTPALSVATAGLASLTVALPERGTAYFFTTPGEETELYFRSTPWEALGRAGRLMLASLLLLIGWFIVRNAEPRAWLTLCGGRWGLAFSGLLLLAGLALLLTGMFSLVGLAIVATIITVHVVRWFV